MTPYWIKDIITKIFPEPKEVKVTCEVCNGRGYNTQINTAIVEGWEVKEPKRCSKCNGRGLVKSDENLSEGF
jgi:DnaJ-class molecular chaperone